MEIVDAGLVAEFVVESQEGLAKIEQQMLAVEAGGVDADPDLINAVFRTMHTIKGTAGFLALDRIGALAHGLEEVLDSMRNREIASSSELVTAILKAADFMKGLIDSIETSNDADITQHVAVLHQFKPGATLSQTVAAVEVSIGLDASTETITNTSELRLSDAAREFLIECYENLDRMDQELLALEQTPASEPLLRGIFRTIHTIKGGAGFLGLSSLEKLAHAAENALGKLRDGQHTR